MRGPPLSWHVAVVDRAQRGVGVDDHVRPVRVTAGFGEVLLEPDLMQYLHRDSPGAAPVGSSPLDRIHKIA